MCVSKLVDEGTSLVIHCSDGWDRTAQIVSLTKLCADPFYRTTKGFQVLVEQEWCAFGHQFRARSGHTSDRTSYWEDDNTSPVFLQFVDAVWQLLRQFPCSFEFNERYLVAVLDEAYTKKSGTFLYDCEEQRIVSRTVGQVTECIHLTCDVCACAKQGSRTAMRCLSAWALLDMETSATDFQNPFYVVPILGEGAVDRSPAVLQFKWHTSSLAIWSAFYLRSLESNDSRVSQVPSLLLLWRSTIDCTHHLAAVM